MSSDDIRSVLQRIEQGDQIRFGTAGGSVDESSGTVRQIVASPSSRAVDVDGPRDGRYRLLDDGETVRQYNIRPDNRVHDWGEIERLSIEATNPDADPDAGDGIVDHPASASGPLDERADDA